MPIRQTCRHTHTHTRLYIHAKKGPRLGFVIPHHGCGGEFRQPSLPRHLRPWCINLYNSCMLDWLRGGGGGGAMQSSRFSRVKRIGIACRGGRGRGWHFAFWLFSRCSTRFSISLPRRVRRSVGRGVRERECATTRRVLFVTNRLIKIPRHLRIFR